ncbi:carboxypeptidase T [Prauserella isguenensis]|uniref:Zinc carboxypeptidase n=1 Tax=Prauserella isguenensis TaxID=1470180 RepID=A0A839S5U7_9PSEU|nr:M14 family metallopeptidase [Prauserella isguenensis]MBB3053461.1 carboxypeptidase T [Prauserella isguenensis]
MRITRRTLSVTTGLLLLLATAAPAGAQGPTTSENAATPERGVYEITPDRADRGAISRSGVDVLGSRGGTLTVVADAAQTAQLRGDGVDLTAIGDFDAMLADRNPDPSEKRAAADEFPAGDEGFHTYSELTTLLENAAADHPDITQLSDVGSSHEGRTIPLMKISADAAQDSDEPEVLFTCNQHAREHLTTEMCLRIVERFTDGYGTDQTVTDFVDSREIYVIPTVNPDGSEHDIEGGQYQGWRKNRQGQGTDLNRNWGYKWGCCDGSSGDPASETYRGEAGFSAPETAAVRDFVDSRVVDGRQQLKGHIDFHTYGELVLWPFGHTTDEVTEDMTREQARRFQDVGREMAGSNGYTPQQSSDLYVTDGDVNGWMWGEHRILSFTFEMYPASGGGLDGFYPDDEDIAPETERNDEAVDILLREAGA